MNEETSLLIHRLQKELSTNGQLILHIKVVPKSAKSELVGMLGEDKIKIRIAAIAAKNKANKELTTYLAKLFKVPKSNISITKGTISPNKTVILQNRRTS